MDPTQLAALRNALTPERVCFLPDVTKEQALNMLLEALSTSPRIGDPDELKQAIFKREELMSTGIGLGLAVPHVRIPSVSDVVMAAGVCPSGVRHYASLDDQPVHLVFMIAAPADQHPAYLRLLATLSNRAKQVKTQLLTAKDPQSFFEILTETTGNPEG